MSNTIITINRECGTGGGEIARLLGEKLGYKVYARVTMPATTTSVSTSPASKPTPWPLSWPSESVPKEDFHAKNRKKGQ